MSSAISYSVAISLPSPFLRTRPMDWRLRIRDLLGEAKIILCKRLMLIPVEKVPYDAIIIALSSVSVI